MQHPVDLNEIQTETGLPVPAFDFPLLEKWPRNSTHWGIWCAVPLLVAAGLVIALAVASYDKSAAPRRVAGLTVPIGLPGRDLTIPPDAASAIAPGDARAINASVPFFQGVLRPARPFDFVGTPQDRIRAEQCLAAAQLYEAGLADTDQKAVAQVVLNRVRHPAFPHTVCGVVFEGAERATGCQFTFTCDGSLARHYPETAWQKARALAAKMLDGSIDPRVGWATHYHTDWVYPYWSPSLDKLSAIGTHLFFAWRGYWGTGPAFAASYQGGEMEIARLPGQGLAGQGAEDSTLADASPSAMAAMGEGGRRPLADLALPAGLSPELMNGNSLKLVHPDGGAYGLLLHQGASADEILGIALRLCYGQSFCKVMGWTSATDVPHSFPVPSTSMAAVRFAYVRDPDAPRVTTRFDCALFPRSRSEQCL